MRTRYKAGSAIIVLILLGVFVLSYPGEGTWQDRVLWGLEALTQVLNPQATTTPQPAAFPLPQSSPTLPPTSRPSPTPPTAWWTFHVTQPTCPPEDQRHGGLDELVADDLKTARQRVDIAMFDLDAQPIVNALIDLKAAGKQVRVVTDSDNERQSSIRRLRRHGIRVVTDKRRGFMHNKFIIIDDRVVWTGSLNLTSNGVYCNHNNFVRFDGVPQLVENYRAEMDEMYEQRAFGPKSPRNTPYPLFTYREDLIQNIFPPETSALPPIARALSSAQQEIDIMAFSFTSRILGETVLGRAESGVTVRALFEEMGADNETSYFVQLQRDRYPNVTVKKATDRGIMHHKVIIIDGRTVVFGSYNFTDNADKRNDENVLIIEDEALAQAFLGEFHTLWTHAEPGFFTDP